MNAHGHEMRDLFQQELQALQHDAVAFADAHPTQAAALRLTRSGANDPQVQMLMQSFAFLSARVLHEMEASKALLANALLEQIYPHLAAPVPCIAVAQLEVKPDAADGAVLARGRMVHAPVNDDHGRRVDCKFQTTSDWPLSPLAVRHTSLLQPQSFPAHLHDPAVLSALCLRVENTGPNPIRAIKNRVLRLHIVNQHNQAALLHEFLAVHLVGMSLVPAAKGAQTPAPRHLAGELHWLGFGAQEAALIGKANMHPGHMLLQEYFACADKFMFFDTPALDVEGVEQAFDLYFHFNRAVPSSRTVNPNALQLNCVPLVNLFVQRIDPIALDHTRFEYPLQADVRCGPNCEVHSLLDLHSIKPDGTLRMLRPYFEMESVATLKAQDYFYTLRRDESPVGPPAGDTQFIAFLDTTLQPAVPAPEVVGGRAWCTNAELPQRMSAGTALTLEGPGPIKGLRLVARPSAHSTHPSRGARPWSMVSQLSLNHVSLAEGPQALAALKGMLRDHVGPAQQQGIHQIDGLRNLSCERVLRPLVRDGQRGLVDCLSVTISLERSHFEHTGVVLFATVLRHFLAMYATVNTLVELTLTTTDALHPLKTWPPMAGTQVVL